MEVFGVSPTQFEATRSDFLEVRHQDSGLPLGEQVYTARGSQSGSLGTYVANQLQVDPESGNSFDQNTMLFYHQFTWNQTLYGKVFRLRPMTIYTLAPMFTFGDRAKSGRNA